MKFAYCLPLLVASSAHAGGWEWKRQPVTAEEYCEIKRIEKLNWLPRCQLNAVVEVERAAMNHRTMMQYNRMLPTPQPIMPTPEVVPPGRGIFRLSH